MHEYLIGKSGTGKSTFLQNLILQNMGGFALLDPHGDLIRAVLKCIPDSRRQSVVVFDATTAVPEPATWAMMLLGFAGLGFVSYRKTRKTVSIAG